MDDEGGRELVVCVVAVFPCSDDPSTGDSAVVVKEVSLQRIFCASIQP